MRNDRINNALNAAHRLAVFSSFGHGTQPFNCHDAIRALPSRQYIGWDQDDTAELEQRLEEREQDQVAGQVR